MKMGSVIEKLAQNPKLKEILRILIKNREKMGDKELIYRIRPLI